MTMTLSEFMEQIEVGLSEFAPCGTCGKQRLCEQCRKDINDIRRAVTLPEDD